MIAATALLVPLLVSQAAAEPRRVLLVGAEPGLQAAVRTALEPWHIEVLALSRAGAGAPGTALERVAPRLARQLAVGAVVWIHGASAEQALWLYDAAGDRTARIKLETRPPFDDPTAAAVALTVKTLLRHSALAPEAERIAVAAPAPATRLSLEVTGSVRARPLDTVTLEPRMGLGVSWYPRRAIGVFAQLELGSGLAIDDATFAGRFTDTAAGAGVSLRHEVGPVALAAAAGAGLHFTSLDGATRPDDARARVSRVNPEAQLGARLAVPVTERVEIGAAIQAAFALRRQRYLVGPQVVLDLPPVELDAGAFASVSFL